jgi:ribosome-binding ATPase YchF (GTP1/OBG family)
VAVRAKIELEISQPTGGRGGVPRRSLASGAGRSGDPATYDLLGYHTFLTVGEDECRAWSIPRGTTAHVAAGEIHSDIARGFIRAEVVRLADLAARGSIAACREHGEVRLEGKDYVVQDGDVVTFRFAT